MSNKIIKITIIILSTVIALIIFLVVLGLYRQNMTPPADPNNEPGESAELSPGIVEVEQIRISLEESEMLLGTRFRPEVIIQPADATDKFYEIHSDDENILRFIGGYWIAAEVGTANLIATASNGIMGTAAVTVTPPVLETLVFSVKDLSLAPGEEVLLRPVFTPEEAGSYVTIQYTSDNENAAVVSDEGLITAVDSGTATITASAGDVNAEVKVTVIIPVNSISIEMPRRIFAVGDQAEFTIVIDPPNATNANVSVSYSGASVTPVGENSFTCDAAGDVTITFSAENTRPIEITILVHDLAALANEVYSLTNIERVKEGLPEFERYSLLNQTAILRARELIELFSHTRPDGRAFYTAFTDTGVEYIYAGENLAAGQKDPAEAVQQWMDSPGHRENILTAEFGRIGVGVTMDNNGRLYWTQMFMD